MTDDIEALLEHARRAHRNGDPEAAVRAWAAAADAAHAAARPDLEAYALRHLSDMDREAGRFAQALAGARRAAELYDGGGAGDLDRANAMRLQALALEGLGRASEAREAWRAARDLYLDVGVAAGVAESEARLAS